MSKQKIIRVTTVPMSLKILLKGQLKFMSQYYDVVAVSSPGNDLNIVRDSENVRTYAINMTRAITPFKDTISLIRMIFFLNKEKPYIIHSHTPKAGLIAMLGAYFARIPNRLHTIAGLPLMEAKGVKRKILVLVEKITSKLATKVYSNSYGLMEFMLQEKLCKKEKLKVIAQGSTNGINIDFFSNSVEIQKNAKKIKYELGINDNSFVYCFVGRIVKDKGINELINVFSKLEKNVKNLTLLLVGDFEEEYNSIKAETIDIIKENVNIKNIGFQNDIRPYLSIANVFVFPSYREGLPNVLLQAGCFNLPSIASNINGNNEIITNMKNGLLIEPKNQEQLYKAMLNLYSDNKLRTKLTENARKEIVKKYKQQYLWKGLLEEYQAL